MKRCRKLDLPRRSRLLLWAVVSCGFVLPAADPPMPWGNSAIAGRRRDCVRPRYLRLGRTHLRGHCPVPERRIKPAPVPEPLGWKRLFDGKSLAGWSSVNFGGEGDVGVDDGKLMLDFGNSLTGITYTQGFPKRNYEVRLEAMQVDGIDFFCGLTFPVGESFCSLIVGGWAGAVVGLSNIDDRDASQNETTRYLNFKNGVWYRIRLRVTTAKIEAWIDDKKVVDQVITDRKISTRPEVDLCKPFGIASYDTRAALRNIEVREWGEEN